MIFTYSCRQNCNLCRHDHYFLKIAVLSPILSPLRLVFDSSSSFPVSLSFRLKKLVFPGSQFIYNFHLIMLITNIGPTNSPLPFLYFSLLSFLSVPLWLINIIDLLNLPSPFSLSLFFCYFVALNQPIWPSCFYSYPIYMQLYTPLIVSFCVILYIYFFPLFFPAH